jgi:hypothetical protein
MEMSYTSWTPSKVLGTFPPPPRFPPLGPLTGFVPPDVLYPPLLLWLPPLLLPPLSPLEDLIRNLIP